MALSRVIPAGTKDTARLVVKQVVDELMKRLDEPLRSAISGALDRSQRNRRPRHAEIDWHVGGEGFTWETQDKDRDARAAQAAWAKACQHLSNTAIGLVVLDEMTYAFKYGCLDLAEVIARLQTRPEMQNVIVTGRAAPDALRDAADTVSDIANEKHAFQAGIKAMPGLDW